MKFKLPLRFDVILKFPHIWEIHQIPRTLTLYSKYLYYWQSSNIFRFFLSLSSRSSSSSSSSSLLSPSSINCILNLHFPSLLPPTCLSLSSPSSSYEFPPFLYCWSWLYLLMKFPQISDGCFCSSCCWKLKLTWLSF